MDKAPGMSATISLKLEPIIESSEQGSACYQRGYADAQDNMTPLCPHYKRDGARSKSSDLARETMFRTLPCTL